MAILRKGPLDFFPIGLPQNIQFDYSNPNGFGVGFWGSFQNPGIDVEFRYWFPGWPKNNDVHSQLRRTSPPNVSRGHLKQWSLLPKLLGEFISEFQSRRQSRLGQIRLMVNLFGEITLSHLKWPKMAKVERLNTHHSLQKKNLVKGNSNGSLATEVFGRKTNFHPFAWVNKRLERLKSHRLSSLFIHTDFYFVFFLTRYKYPNPRIYHNDFNTLAVHIESTFIAHKTSRCPICGAKFQTKKYTRKAMICSVIIL